MAGRRASIRPAQWRQPIGPIESSRPWPGWTRIPSCAGRLKDFHAWPGKAGGVREAFQMKTYPVYLNGDLTVTEKFSQVRNPATGEVFARMSVLGRPVVAQAI